MTVPAKAEMPRIAYTACNGTEDEEVFSQQNLQRNARWGHLNGLHRTRPFHLLLHGGDQLYADALWKECPSLKDWNALPAREALAAPSLRKWPARRKPSTSTSTVGSGVRPKWRRCIARSHRS